MYQRYWKRNQRHSQRKKLIEMLGNVCKKCGTNDIRVLQIDHKNPIGQKNRLSGVLLVRAIITKKENISNLQLLCANCHMIKTFEEDRMKFKNWKSSVEYRIYEFTK